MYAKKAVAPAKAPPGIHLAKALSELIVTHTS
jgi:hypothetical protein